MSVYGNQKYLSYHFRRFRVDDKLASYCWMQYIPVGNVAVHKFPLLYKLYLYRRCFYGQVFVANSVDNVLHDNIQSACCAYKIVAAVVVIIGNKTH